MKRPLSTRARLAPLAATVRSIEKQQESHPGFMQEMLEAIVNSELRKLEAEQARFQTAHKEGL